GLFALLDKPLQLGMQVECRRKISHALHDSSNDLAIDCCWSLGTAWNSFSEVRHLELFRFVFRFIERCDIPALRRLSQLRKLAIADHMLVHQLLAILHRN